MGFGSLMQFFPLACMDGLHGKILGGCDAPFGLEGITRK